MTTQMHNAVLSTLAMPPAIRTWSGRTFNLLDPDPASVSIKDIAHALSHICRFNGHSNRFYSVAEHSVLVAHAMLDNDPQANLLTGLLHDAAEAYLGDVTSPLKQLLQPAYGMLTNRVEGAIAKRLLDLPDGKVFSSEAVKRADLMVLMAERAALFDEEPCTSIWRWADGIPAADVVVAGLEPPVAKALFLEYFETFRNA